MSDLIVSYIRTFVPVAVGAALAWIAGKVGVIVPADDVAPHVVAVCVAGYYVLARFLESRVSWLGWLLGMPKPPVYDVPAVRG